MPTFLMQLSAFLFVIVASHHITGHQFQGYIFMLTLWEELSHNPIHMNHHFHSVVFVSAFEIYQQISLLVHFKGYDSKIESFCI